MTLGEAGVAGNDEKHFGRPTDIAWLPDGSFFVADGYTNSRIVKFDRNGKYVSSWGTKGIGPGQFNPTSRALHCVAGGVLGAQPSHGSNSVRKKLFGSETRAPLRFGGIGTATAPSVTTVSPALFTAATIASMFWVRS